jgi:hypothetical protein
MSRVMSAPAAHQASGLLNGRADYLSWGVIQISLANLLVIVVMILIFVAALLLPFPGSGTEDQEGGGSDADH